MGWDRQILWRPVWHERKLASGFAEVRDAWSLDDLREANTALDYIDDLNARAAEQAKEKHGR